MGEWLRSMIVRAVVWAARRGVFSVRELRSEFGWSSSMASQVVAKLLSMGVLRRIAKGRYIVDPGFYERVLRFATGMGLDEAVEEYFEALWGGRVVQHAL